MPLLWISIAFLAGAVVTFFCPIFWQAATVAGSVFIILSAFEWRGLNRFSAYVHLRKSLPVPLCLLAAAFCGGLIRGETGKPSFISGDLGWYNGREQVTLRAMASQPAENHDSSTMLTVSAQEISTDGNAFVPVQGEAVILLPAGKELAYGDRLEITGNLDTPPERVDFSYRQYLENRGVFSYMAYPRIQLLGQNMGNPLLAAIFKLRDRIADIVVQIIPQPEAAFLSGMLVGRDEAIPDGLKKAFQNTGTSHLVAISGFNITILSGLILALTNRLLPRGWSVLTAIVLLSGYAMMAGASPSVVRAAIMGALAMIGRSIGRTRTAVNSLGLAAGIMVLDNPLILRDIGFQLSVVATAGILLIGAPLNDWFVKKTTSPDRPAEANLAIRSLGEFILITLAAQLATLPVLLYHFHQYPLIGLLVNPLVLPVQPAAMILGGAAVLAGMVFLPFGKILGLAAWVPLAYTTRMVELFSVTCNSGLINMHLELWQAAALGFILILAVFFRNTWVKKISRFIVPAIFVGLVGVLAVMVNTLYLRPDGKLHIQVYRQGKDISTFIITPGGQHLLVTNRPGDKDLIAFVDRRLPIFRKGLDAVILPNPTASSSNGLADSLYHFRPEWLFINNQSGGYRVQSKLEAVFSDQSFHNQPLVTDLQIDLGAGAVLSVQQLDEKGCGMVLVWGAERFDIQYGSSTGNTTFGRYQYPPIGALILDHPDESLKDISASIILDADTLPANTDRKITVKDGNWLEIRSDGKATEILEKSNESS